jgi:flagellar basal-body rod protein FlgF
MDNASLVGLSRLVALEREIDVVANNIANLNTAGFKSDGVVFQEYVDETASSGDPSGTGTAVSFVYDVATWIDLGQGAMERTGNALDVAIDGSGFLAVQTPDGERYTRNGALQVNANGELVTSAGFQVLGDSGPITMQPTDHHITISQDGTISVREGENVKTESQRGRLRMVGFEQPGLLLKEGSGTFMAPENVTPQVDTKSRFVQGTLEKSNVHGVVEMTRMIDVTRSYTQVANMLVKEAELQQAAINKLAEVPA